MKKFLPALLIGLFLTAILGTLMLVPKKSINREMEEMEKDEFPGEAAAYWQARLETPNGENPALLNYQAKQHIQALRKTGTSSNLAFGIENYGPGNFGGRTRSILVHPDHPEHLLTGGVSGGVWTSQDGGQIWAPTSDFLSNIAISCMAYDPDQPDVVYLGTGEGFYGGGMMRGLGIFKSTDFGQTWTQLPTTTDFRFYYVNRIAVVPGSGAILAATGQGIFRSSDEGQTWDDVSSGQAFNRGFVDLKVDPSNPNIVLASHYGLQGGNSGVVTIVQVNAPENLVGQYANSTAAFGPSIATVGPITADLALYEDGGATTSMACVDTGNAAALSGKIALIDRGDCTFVDKVKRAQNAGAVAVLIGNYDDDIISMGGADASITIPALMITKTTTDLLKSALPGGVNITMDSQETTDAGSYVARSEDGGQSFVILGTDEGMPSEDVQRIELGWGTDGVVYASISNTSNQTLGLWKSTNHGQTFTKTSLATSYIERQGWYDLMVGVDPSDSNRVYLGAVDVFRSVDGGSTATKITKWNPGNGDIPQFVHADIHTIAFDPDAPQTLYIGCDGGVFKSDNGGNSFSSLNNDLRLAQNYGLAIHPDGQRIITGTQDNGSHLYFGDKAVWLEWYGGDGGFCAWDQQEPNYVYGSLPFTSDGSGDIFVSDNGGASAVRMIFRDSSGANFIEPFVLDPNDGNRMMVGTDHVFLSTDVRKRMSAHWEDVSGDIGTINALAFNPVDPEKAYAGTNTGSLFTTNQLSTSTTFELLNAFSGYVTSISFDPADANTMFVTLSRYSPDRVWKSTDGGQSWVSIHGDLPNIPVHELVADPVVPGQIFLGTELGLFLGTPSGETYHWEHLDYGIAWTRVVRMGWGDADHLWVATHGRGTYKLHRNPVSISSENHQINGDGDVYLDGGESHLVSVKLKNTSPTQLNNLQVHLDTQAEGVFLGDSEATVSLDGLETKTIDFPISLNQVFDSPTDIALSGTLTLAGRSYPFEVPLTLCGDPNVFEGTYIHDGESLVDWNSTIELGQEGWSVDPYNVHSGGGALFAQAESKKSLSTLTSRDFIVDSDTAQLSFWMSYDLEGSSTQYSDGVVLEAEVDGGDWFDLGNRAQNASYDGQLHTDTTLYLRNAWSGIQKDWRQVVINLGDFKGQTIRFRFRLASDSGTYNQGGGMWIDDMQLEGVQWDETPLADTAFCTSCQVEPSQKEYLYYLPYVKGGNDSDTLVKIINAWNETSVQVEFVGFSATGSPLMASNQEIPASGALNMGVNELFPGQAAQIEWVQIGATAPVEILGDVIDDQTRSAYLASTGVSSDLFVPHIAKNTALFETHLISVNGSEDISSLKFASDQGNEYNIQSDFDSWQQSHVLARDLLGDQVSQTNWGKLESSVANMASMEYFSNPGQVSRMASLGLNQESGNQLRFLHLAADTNLFWTGMVYFNSSDTELNAQESYYNNAGELLDEKPVTLTPGEKHTILFDHTTTAEQVPVGSGWMEVNADQPMVGYELFGSSVLSSNDYFAGLQGSYSQGQTLVFQVFLATNTEWTGIVLINVGDEASDMTLQAFDAQGNLLETTATGSIDPKAKKLYLASDLFSEATMQQTSWVKAVAEGSQWDGFSLWGDHGTEIRKYLAGVKAAVK